MIPKYFTHHKALCFLDSTLFYCFQSLESEMYPCLSEELNFTGDIKKAVGKPGQKRIGEELDIAVRGSAIYTKATNDILRLSNAMDPIYFNTFSVTHDIGKTGVFIGVEVFVVFYTP